MKTCFNPHEFANKLKEHCSKAQSREFKKGEVITTYLVNRNQICILLSGTAYLVRYNDKGMKSIIYSFKENDVFGEAFYKIHTNRELFVLAKQDCEVLFFTYDSLHEKCNKNCTFHNELIISLPDLVFSKVMELNTRIELLSNRGIREKLLSYFSILSTENFSNSFYLPFSLTDLADYLIVDRTAMMREIKRLKDEGFIHKVGNKITLLYK